MPDQIPITMNRSLCKITAYPICWWNFIFKSCHKLAPLATMRTTSDAEMKLGISHASCQRNIPTKQTINCNYFRSTQNTYQQNLLASDARRCNLMLGILGYQVRLFKPLILRGGKHMTSSCYNSDTYPLS